MIANIRNTLKDQTYSALKSYKDLNYTYYEYINNLTMALRLNVRISKLKKMKNETSCFNILNGIDGWNSNKIHILKAIVRSGIHTYFDEDVFYDQYQNSLDQFNINKLNDNRLKLYVQLWLDNFPLSHPYKLFHILRTLHSSGSYISTCYSILTDNRKKSLSDIKDNKKYLQLIYQKYLKDRHLFDPPFNWVNIGIKEYEFQDFMDSESHNLLTLLHKSATSVPGAIDFIKGMDLEANIDSLFSEVIEKVVNSKEFNTYVSNMEDYDSSVLWGLKNLSHLYKHGWENFMKYHIEAKMSSQNDYSFGVILDNSNENNENNNFISTVNSSTMK